MNEGGGDKSGSVQLAWSAGSADCSACCNCCRCWLLNFTFAIISDRHIPQHRFEPLQLVVFELHIFLCLVDEPCALISLLFSPKIQSMPTCIWPPRGLSASRCGSYLHLCPRSSLNEFTLFVRDFRSVCVVFASSMSRAVAIAAVLEIELDFLRAAQGCFWCKSASGGVIYITCIACCVRSLRGSRTISTCSSPGQTAPGTPTV